MNEYNVQSLIVFLLLINVFSTFAVYLEYQSRCLDLDRVNRRLKSLKDSLDEIQKNTKFKVKKEIVSTIRHWLDNVY